MTSAASRGAVRRRFTILNERGLHARAAARFVAVLDAFSATIEVEKDNMTVSGRSIMGLMMLGAAIGTTIDVVAHGDDAGAALDALGRLVGNRFDE